MQHNEWYAKDTSNKIRAIGQVFTLGEDFLFPYYRDMLTVLSAGMTPEELILNGISKATDPGSAGRHMSNHFAKPEWHIENISSATGTHDLHGSKQAAKIQRLCGNLTVHGFLLQIQKYYEDEEWFSS